METQTQIKSRMLDFEKETQVLASIVTAIETNNSIQFCYTKEILSSGIRVVNPHNLYWNKDNTKILLDGFQTQGSSKTETLQQFKQFDVKFITDVLILNDTFEINKTYNPESKRYNNSILGVT
jgi:hypothetical protein